MISLSAFQKVANYITGRMQGILVEDEHELFQVYGKYDADNDEITTGIVLVNLNDTARPLPQRILEGSVTRLVEFRGIEGTDGIEAVAYTVKDQVGSVVTTINFDYKLEPDCEKVAKHMHDWLFNAITPVLVEDKKFLH